MEKVIQLAGKLVRVDSVGSTGCKGHYHGGMGVV